MRYSYALLQRLSKVAQTREGPREVSIWYLGKEMITGVSGGDTLEEALNFVQSQGWERVPDEVGQDAALMKRPRR